MIDGLLVAAVSLVIGRDVSGWLATVIGFGYETLMVGGRGRTIGQAVVRVRVTLLDGSTRPSLEAAAIRAVVPLLGSVVVAIAHPVGGLSLRIAAVLASVWGLIVYAPVFGREVRGWHDRASGTEVLVDVPRGSARSR